MSWAKHTHTEDFIQERHYPNSIVYQYQGAKHTLSIPINKDIHKNTFSGHCNPDHSTNSFATVLTLADGKEIVFVWVPGHVGISFNSATDFAAKNALDGDVSD